MTNKNDKVAVVEYEEILGIHPVSGKTQLVKIEKAPRRTPEEAAAHTKAELAKYGLEPIMKVTVEDPLTGEKKLITLDRSGYSEAKLVAILADPDTSRERKDHELSMYMWERGGESMSMMVDLIRYKGQHSKESNVFKSQIRFDFEAFLSTFCMSLEDEVGIASQILGIDVAGERGSFYAFVGERVAADQKAAKESGEEYKRKEYTYFDYLVYKEKTKASKDRELRMWAMHVAKAIHAYDTASLIRKRIESIRDARERDKGKGVYLSASGRPYTLNDPELDEIIKGDREATQKIKKEE